MLGADEETIAAIEAAETREQGEVAIWPENWETVLAFASLVTQWRIVALPSGKLFYQGLDYAAVRARLDPDPDLWDNLQVMEMAAREAANAS